MRYPVIVSAISTFIFVTSAQSAPSVVPGHADICSTLQDMLVETQANRPRFNALEFAVIDRGLKEKYLSLCEENGVKTIQKQGLEQLSYARGGRMWEQGRWYLPDGSEFKSDLLQSASSSAPILGPFLEAHRSCASGCGYVSWGIWGDEAHQRRRSCHNSGEAIDIHAITCGGTHKALSSRFDEYVDCMRGSLGVIYRSANHYNHAHFQLNGCNMCQGLRCGGGHGSPSKPRPEPEDNDESENNDDNSNDESNDDSNDESNDEENS
jgi:hypothetical protein